MAASPSIDQVQKEAMARVRAAPADASARMKLFRISAVTGNWERALNQLDVAATADAALAYSAMVYRQLVGGERFRAEVFAGKRTPVFAGEPERWIALLVEALRADAGGAAGAAQALRTEALELAPATPGQLDGMPFQWIADADGRLGPVLEAFIDGKYYWIPFGNLAEVEFEEPTDWLDMVWATAQITFASGGTKPAHVPVRYPGSEGDADDAIRLSRMTRWLGDDDAGYRGLGQRVLTTDADEVGLLQARRLSLTPTPAA